MERPPKTSSPQVRNWSALPDDLLRRISDTLGLVDYGRLGAVCVSWRRAAAGRRRHPPLRRQPPWWLCIPRDGAEPTAADFFCLGDNRWYRLDLTATPITRRLPIGSGDGWVATADEASEIHLLNPITGEQVPLPSILTLPTISGVRDADGRLAGYLETGPDGPAPLGLEVARKVVYRKVVLSCSSSSNWTAVLMCFDDPTFCFARPGDGAWNTMPEIGFVDDVIYHKGLFYVVQHHLQRITAWDLTGPSPRGTRIGPALPVEDDEIIFTYLVESGGDLLQVWRSRGRIGEEDEENGEEEDGTRRRLGFSVFKLDERNQKWEGVKSLGERALFLGLYHSMSLSTLEYPELKRNCIYFTDDGWKTSKNKEGGHYILVFNLEDESIEPYCPSSDHHNCPPHIWIMPRPF